MLKIPNHRKRELAISIVVMIGVFGTGVYDFLHERPPGRLNLDRPVGLGMFSLVCLGNAAAATALAVKDRRNTMLTLALGVTGVLGAVIADPSYASLLTTAVLIDLRRRGSDPWRGLGAAAVLLAVVVLVLTERAPAATNEWETRLGLAIAFAMIVLLGDALKEVDVRVRSEASLAELNERNRLAEDIHDSLGHHLLAASVQLESAKALQSREQAATHDAIESAASAVAHAVAETRLIVEFGREADQQGVPLSLQELVRMIVPEHIEMRVETTGNHESLKPAVQIAIYRLVQEALTNLVRHSTATAASIESVVKPHAIAVTICDNGTGFEPDEVGHGGGLGNMRRRVEAVGGQFELKSTPRGTSVIATVPV